MQINYGMTKPLTVIIDGNSLMNVFYHATLPIEAKKADNSKAAQFYELLKKNRYGVYVDALRLFVKYISVLTNSLRPSKLAVCFDVPGGSSFRKDAYPEYKGTRGEKPTPLLEQIDIAQFWLKKCGVPVYADPRCEADDVVASLASKCAMTDRVYVVTTDHDYYQMITDDVQALMYIPNSKKYDELKQKYPDRCFLSGRFVLYDSTMVEKEVGIKPFQIPDFKGLSGDTSDNIPSVPGIGEKTAIALLTMYADVNQLLEEVEAHDTDSLSEIWKIFPDAKIRGSAKVINSLKENKDTVKLSKWLATTWSNVPVSECPILNIDISAWSELLDFIKIA